MLTYANAGTGSTCAGSGEFRSLLSRGRWPVLNLVAGPSRRPVVTLVRPTGQSEGIVLTIAPLGS